jgi:hypothetical protein
MTKYLGLISFIIIVGGLFFTVWRWPGGLHMTFSQHVARRRSSVVYYSLFFALSLPLLCIFLVDWFAPTYQLPSWYNLLVIVSSIFQFLCTLVPEITGWRVIAHRILTGVSGVLLLPATALIITSPVITRTDKVLAGTCLAGMTILLAIALKNQKHYPYALLLQGGYYLLFFVPILFITYL